MLKENDYVTVDTDSLGDKAFLAKEKPFEALANVGKEQLLKLRGIISRHPRMGKAIANDFAPNSFYFYQQDGKGYNGGIIWHGPEHGYSAHAWGGTRARTPG